MKPFDRVAGAWAERRQRHAFWRAWPLPPGSEPH